MAQHRHGASAGIVIAGGGVAGLSLALALKAGSESECFPTKLLADALQAVRAAERRYIDAALIY